MKTYKMHAIPKQGFGAAVLLVIIVASSVLGLFLPTPILARFGLDDPRQRYFSETGFWVTGDFLDYFEVNGDLEIFGYPISSTYNQNGVLVQYFQKARMEWHTSNPEPYNIQLGLLGIDLGLDKGPVAPPNSAGKVYFDETGHVVTYMFLRYFRDHGGVDIFGYPISEMLNENQKIVQYFQRLKLIWDPMTSQMTVGNLGEIYVNAYRSTIPSDVLQPGSYRTGDLGIKKLRVAVGMSSSMARQDSGQTVTVVVLDDWLNEPVPNALVNLTLSDDSGQEFPDLSQTVRTNEEGRVDAFVPLKDVRPGTWLVLRIEATLDQNNVRQVEKKFFLVWW